MQDSVELEEVRVTLADRGYTLLNHIGKGHFANVYTVTSARYPDQIFCAKVIKLDTNESESSRDTFQAELDSLLQLTHPNIVCAYAHFSSEHFCYLILEYCEHGSISELISRQGPLDSQTLRLFCRQILSAIQYLHAVNFCHRDIKPANILVDKYGRPKLADFGFAKNASRQDDKICGSLPYQSPELIRCRTSADPAMADMWAIGVTFYEMAFGRLPWTSQRPATITTEICDGSVAFPPGASLTLSALIKILLSVDPERRRTAEECLRMPYFAVASSLPSSSSSPDVITGKRLIPIRTLKALNSPAIRATRSVRFLSLHVSHSPVPE
jgi:serine/threonine protein kinase